jgi:AraC family transcriptional regulator of adaptative response/methylated-DNA-[protein]-cysteine methyltransferase
VIEERDYILRLIAMAGEMVRRALERLHDGEPSQALDQLEIAVERLSNTSPDLVARLTPEGLVTFLGAGAPPDPRVATSLAEALDARGRALDALGQGAASALALAQARALRAAVAREGAHDAAEGVVGYATAGSPLGRVLVATASSGVCAVLLGDDDASLTDALRVEFPDTPLADQDAGSQALADALAAYLAGGAAMPDAALDPRGTDFQRRVWAALREVPAGETVTYAELARRIGAPAAYRAVANACGANRIAVLVPCHRAVRTDGTPGGYRWGAERKRRLLTLERARIG